MTIRSLTALLPYATDLEPGENGIFALDLDYTLIKPPLIASDDLNFFLEATNRMFEYEPNAHRYFVGQVQYEVDYLPCENVEIVKEVIDTFRKKGWQFKIFTARKECAREITFRHIRSAGFTFDERDVVFCGRSDKGTEIEQEAGSAGKLRVVGADDQMGHVYDIKRLAKRVSDCVVDYFQFMAEIPSPQLTDAQRQELKVELRNRLPEERREQWLDDRVLMDRALHRLVREVSEEMGFPFEKAKFK